MRQSGLIITLCCVLAGWGVLDISPRPGALIELRQNSNADPRSESIRKGVKYLWSQQGSDGGWHSKTYGLLRSGQSLTPFVLFALLCVPDDIVPLPRQNVQRALDFILLNTDAEGALGRSDAMLMDYPNFSTSLAVRCFEKANAKGWNFQTQQMVQFLLQEQFTEARNWNREHPVYGAWGMGGIVRKPPQTGHVDLAMTRHVLQALQFECFKKPASCFQDALVYLGRSQNLDGDGGFYFSTVILEANKAGHDGKTYRSYGTATADGTLALLAAGVRRDDRRLKSAAAWLSNHFRADGVPGFEGHDAKNWTDAMYYYWIAAASQALNALQVENTATGVDWRQAIATELARRQNADGSWVNSEFLMKEDDPLIATAFALQALNQ